MNRYYVGSQCTSVNYLPSSSRPFPPFSGPAVRACFSLLLLFWPLQSLLGTWPLCVHVCVSAFNYTLATEVATERVIIAVTIKYLICIY